MLRFGERRQPALFKAFAVFEKLDCDMRQSGRAHLHQSFVVSLFLRRELAAREL